jgi:ankyrin repeat protein
MVRRLLDSSADVNAITGYENKTALEGATENGHLEVVNKLLETGADVNTAAEHKGNTALQAASKRGQLEMVSRLLDAGADVNVANCGTISAIKAAVAGKHGEVSLKLLDAGAHSNDVHWDLRTKTLHDAAESGNFEVVNRLIDAGADVNSNTLY